jgi:hypothetical protein
VPTGVVVLIHLRDQPASAARATSRSVRLVGLRATYVTKVVAGVGFVRAVISNPYLTSRCTEREAVGGDVAGPRSAGSLTSIDSE